MYKSIETLYDGPQDPTVVNKLLWTAGAPSRMKLTNAQALLIWTEYIIYIPKFSYIRFFIIALAGGNP